MYGKKEEKRVYLATDDQTALNQAIETYPNYKFVSDNDVSKTAGELSSRYSEKGLYGVVLDVVMLSECDYIVCTLSSQVCRLAYELMQAHHVDASRLVYSLDDVYYFGGQQEHVLRAIHRKTENGGGNMDFAKGDLIKIAGNHLNGFSLGNRQGGHVRHELFPSYKAEEEIRVANFPTYPEVS
jgi:glycoprotein 6-alpha-L-fucosyltransferase